MDAPLLEIKNLTKTFGKLVAVNNLSFTVNRGDIFGFLGPNGAGKTTTLRMALGLMQPTSGEVKIFDRNISADPLGILSRVGALIDEPALYGFLSGYSNLKLLGDLGGGVEQERVMEVLKTVGLDDRAHDRVRHYSRGMRVRLGLAQALLNRPELLVLDEPTAGLDPEGSREIQNLIRELAANGGVTVIISSHLLGEIERICNRALILRKGQLLVCDHVHNLLSSESSKVEIGVSDPVAANAFLKNCELVKKVDAVSDYVLVAELKSGAASQLFRELAAANITVNSLNPVRKSLEEYFLDLMDAKNKT
jgi:ABC-2 type transport system ATP-binding protein